MSLRGTRSLMHELWRDGLRPVVRQRGFTLVAALTLALGLGSTTAVATLVDALLLRPLPYPAPERLVVVFETMPGNDRRRVAPGNFVDWRREARGFSSLAAYWTSRRTLVGGASAERVRASSVSGNLFALLGGTPQAGRLLTPGEDSAGSAPAAVLSDGLWRRQFGGSPGVVGRAIVLDDQPYTVIGVAAPDFRFPEPADLWTLGDRGVPVLTGTSGDLTRERDVHYFTVLGQLRQAGTMGLAQAEMDRLAGDLAARHPETNRDLGVSLVPLRDAVIAGRGRTALLLFGVVGVVLLIACANVTNLMLASTAARHREFGLRAALGAPRGRVVLQVMTQSLAIGLLGGALGAGGAALVVNRMSAAGALDLPELTRAHLGPGALLFALLLSGLAGLGFGIVPALRAAAAGNAPGWRQAGRGSTEASSRLRRGLVVAQLALSLTLLVGAGLLLSSYRAQAGEQPGFRVEGRYVLDVALSRAYADRAALGAWVERTTAGLRALPGVRGVTAVMNLPMSGREMNRGVRIEGRPDPERPTDQTVEYQVIGPEYFDVMAIPIRGGRGFTALDDAGATPVAVVNEAAVRRYWPGMDPVGQRIGFGERDGSRTWRTIVGVVGDVRQYALSQAPLPEVYVPLAQDPVRNLSLVVAADGTPDPARMRSAAQVADPDQPVAPARPLSDLLAASVARPRFLSGVLAGFAVAALLLAALGLYGVLAQAVAGRTREIGVRMALGATRSGVLALVLGQAGTLVGLGIGLGAAGALAGARLLGGMLYGVGSTDPAVFVTTVTVLSLAAFLAALLPARRAARVDPAEALRAE